MTYERLDPLCVFLNLFTLHMHKIWTSFNSDNSVCFLAHDSVNQNKTLAKKLPTKNNICQNNNQPNGQSKATCNNHKKSFKMAIY